MPSIIQNLADLFVKRPSADSERKKLRAELDSKIQDQRVYMDQRVLAMRQAAKQKEKLEQSILDEKDPAKQILLVQKLKNAKSDAGRNQKFAMACVRSIAALESEKSVLDLADEMSIAFGEEVSFDAILKDFSVVATQYAQFNQDLVNLESQAALACQVGNQTVSSLSPTADDEDQDILDLLKKIQAEPDPVKRAELEHQYHEKLEMPGIAAFADD